MIWISGASGALGQYYEKYYVNNSNFQVNIHNRSFFDQFSNYYELKNQLKNLIASQKPEIIHHLIGVNSVDFSISFKTNVLLAQAYLESILELGANTKILLVGSAAEYGNIKPKETRLSESSEINPISLYGLTKSWQSNLCSYYSQKGVQVYNARLFNLFSDNLSEKLFVGSVLNQIKNFKKGKINTISVGNLEATRDYICVYEAINQMNHIINFGKIGETYNVASGLPIKIEELLILLLDSANLSLKEININLNTPQSLSNPVPYIVASIKKLEGIGYTNKPTHISSSEILRRL
jgi:nucleoside-diphosphate-sugar epimerase